MSGLAPVNPSAVPWALNPVDISYPWNLNIVDVDDANDRFQPAKSCLQSLRDGFALPDPIGLAAEGVVNGFRIAKDVQSSTGLSLTERGVYDISQDVKELAEVAAFPFRAFDFVSACVDENYDGDSSGIPRPVIATARFIACIPSVTEAVGFLERREIVALDTQTSAIIGSVGNGALVVGNLYGIAEQIINLVNAETALQVGLYLLNLGKHVAYAAAAVLALVAVIFAVVFAPWLLAVVGAVAVGFALTGFFYDKIFDPENKYGPKAVIEFEPDPYYKPPVAAVKV